MPTHVPSYQKKKVRCVIRADTHALRIEQSYLTSIIDKQSSLINADMQREARERSDVSCAELECKGEIVADGR